MTAGEKRDEATGGEATAVHMYNFEIGKMDANQTVPPPPTWGGGGGRVIKKKMETTWLSRSPERRGEAEKKGPKKKGSEHTRQARRLK